MSDYHDPHLIDGDAISRELQYEHEFGPDPALNPYAVEPPAPIDVGQQMQDAMQLANGGENPLGPSDLDTALGDALGVQPPPAPELPGVTLPQEAIAVPPPEPADATPFGMEQLGVSPLDALLSGKGFDFQGPGTMETGYDGEDFSQGYVPVPASGTYGTDPVLTDGPLTVAPNPGTPDDYLGPTGIQTGEDPTILDPATAGPAGDVSESSAIPEHVIDGTVANEHDGAWTYDDSMGDGGAQGSSPQLNGYEMQPDGMFHLGASQDEYVDPASVPAQEWQQPEMADEFSQVYTDPATGGYFTIDPSTGIATDVAPDQVDAGTTVVDGGSIDPGSVSDANVDATTGQVSLDPSVAESEVAAPEDVAPAPEPDPMPEPAPEPEPAPSE